jgi:hypothetical protein
MEASLVQDLNAEAQRAPSSQRKDWRNNNFGAETIPDGGVLRDIASVALNSEYTFLLFCFAPSLALPLRPLRQRFFRRPSAGSDHVERNRSQRFDLDARPVAGFQPLGFDHAAEQHELAGMEGPEAVLRAGVCQPG